MSRPFRFAFSLDGLNGPDEIARRVRRAEDLGYSAVVMTDHFDDRHGPMVALTAAALATQTLRVGHAGAGQRLPAPGRSGQGAGLARPDLGRAARDRHRRRVDDLRLRAGRHDPGPARRAHRAARRGGDRAGGVLRRRAVRLRRPPLHDLGARLAAQARPAAPPPAAHGRRRGPRCWRWPLEGPT